MLFPAWPGPGLAECLPAERERHGPHPLTPFAFGDEFVPGNGKNRP